jgi:hypothetical protein
MRAHAVSFLDDDLARQHQALAVDAFCQVDR